MAGFSAGDVVEALDWKFSNLSPPVRGLEDAEGTIPEPTSLQVERFFTANRKEMLRARQEGRELGIVRDDDDEDEESLTPAQRRARLEALLEALSKIDPARSAAARKRNAQILADLCSGTPSAAQLLLLPHRVYGEFVRWVTGEVLNPEASAAGGTAQVTPLRSVAGG